MKRNMDLARLILFEIEKQPYPMTSPDIAISEYSQNEIDYHIMLLAEAGLIVASDISTNNDIKWLPERLTWEGHEFLDASRDNNNWNKAKEIMKQGGGFVFEVAKQVLIELIKSQVSSDLRIP